MSFFKQPAVLKETASLPAIMFARRFLGVLTRPTAAATLQCARGFHVSAAPRAYGGHDDYRRRYRESIAHPDKFWADEARNQLHWIQPFTETREMDQSQGLITWFKNGKLNAAGEHPHVEAFHSMCLRRLHTS